LASGYPVLVPPEIFQYFPGGHGLAVVGESAGSACVVGAGYHDGGSCGLFEKFKQTGGYVLALVGVVAHDDCGVSDFGQYAGGVVKIALLVFVGKCAQRIKCGLCGGLGVNDELR
jgi:hypothetical protein